MSAHEELLADPEVQHILELCKALPKAQGKRLRPVQTAGGLIVLAAPTGPQWQIIMMQILDDDKAAQVKGMLSAVRTCAIYPPEEELNKMLLEYAGIPQDKDVFQAIRILAGAEKEARAK